MDSALTSVARVHGGTRTGVLGGKRVVISNAFAAAARAAASLGARTIVIPRCELASQLGSSGSIGVSFHRVMRSSLLRAWSMLSENPCRKVWWDSLSRYGREPRI